MDNLFYESSGSLLSKKYEVASIFEFENAISVAVDMHQLYWAIQSFKTEDKFEIAFKKNVLDDYIDRINLNHPWHSVSFSTAKSDIMSFIWFFKTEKILHKKNDEKV